MVLYEYAEEQVQWGGSGRWHGMPVVGESLREPFLDVSMSMIQIHSPALSVSSTISS